MAFLFYLASLCAIFVIGASVMWWPLVARAATPAILHDYWGAGLLIAIHTIIGFALPFLVAHVTKHEHFALAHVALISSCALMAIAASSMTSNAPAALEAFLLLSLLLGFVIGFLVYWWRLLHYRA